MMDDDAELAARLVAGDLDALRAAYDAHSAAVYGVAVRVTRDQALAEEASQEVFVTLWEQPLSYDPRLGPLRDWLAGRALHEAALRVRVG
ncbi:sigma factor [Nonomuraea sp. ZG12]|uniref:sigma factor n=1 Tax=Nonomuraea sp. ZG12 TaxID=3452207 RepID=UPI003F8C3D4F